MYDDILEDNQNGNEGLEDQENERRNDCVQNMDHAFDLVGGWGKHQKIIHLTQLLLMVLGSYALYPMSFYELQPQYEC